MHRYAKTWGKTRVSCSIYYLQPFHSVYGATIVKKKVLNIIWSLLAVGLFQVLFSGWRLRPSSACYGEFVRVTPSSATQKWMRTSLISTLWVELWTSWLRQEISYNRSDLFLFFKGPENLFCQSASYYKPTWTQLSDEVVVTSYIFVFVLAFVTGM